MERQAQKIILWFISRYERDRDSNSGAHKIRKKLLASQVAQWYRIHLPMQETWVQSLDQEDPLEEEMATHSSTLAWRVPGTEEPGGLQSVLLHNVRHDSATKR